MSKAYLTNEHTVKKKKNFLSVTSATFRSPLMLAVLGGHTDCVHFLLEKGALPDAKDKRGSTALHRGVGQKHCMGLHTVAEHQLDHTSLYRTIDWVKCKCYSMQYKLTMMTQNNYN